MSVCDPNSEDCCDSCKTLPLVKYPKTVGNDVVAMEDVTREDDLRDMETRLKALRLEARRLAKSGHPGVAAEGRRAEAKCDEDLAWVRSQLAKEQ